MKNAFSPRFILTLTALSLTLIVHAQLSLNWALSQGSNDSDLTGSCFIDDQGGIYTTVAFRDTIDLDPGSGVNMAYVADDEIFVLNKYNQQGEYQWSSQFKTSGDAYGFIGEIRNNRILIVIYYTDSLVYLHTTPWMTATPGKHVALISMNLEGQIISFQHLANNHQLYFSDFSTQPDGSYLAGGAFEGSVTFATSDSTRTLTSTGQSDAFIAKFNQDVQLEWFTPFAGKGYDNVEKIYTGKGDLIYYAMYHDSTITLQTNQGQVVSPADGEDNTVFGWLQSDGSIESANLFGGDLGDQLRGITADDDGNMYICGYFEGDVNFEHPSGTPVIFSSLNESDGFVSKYRPDGTLVWTRIFTSGEYGGIYTMSLNRNSNLYLTGEYTLLSDMDPGPDSIIVDGGDDGDVFACKLDTDGNLNWVYTFTGNSYEGIRNLVTGTDGKVFIHGYYYDTLDCDPGPGEWQIITAGGSDVFVIGFTEEGVVTASSDMPKTSMLIYPNPAGDYLEIRSDTPIETVDVYAMNGKPVLQHKGKSGNFVKLDINNLTPGIFTLRIKSADQYSTQKFVKAE